MQECRTYGSVRGARGNSRPYRERCRFAATTTAVSTGAFAISRATALNSTGDAIGSICDGAAGVRGQHYLQETAG
jgi:hypothetical protein